MAISNVFNKETKKPVAGTPEDDLILVGAPTVLSPTDTINGGEGQDILRISANKAGKFILPNAMTNVEIVEISATQDPNSTAIVGNTKIDLNASYVTSPLLIYGNDGANEILGGGGADTIYGNIGNDIINGNGGADIIYGGDGDDIIVFADDILEDVIDGGAGNDMLLYAGLNTFVIQPSTQANLTSIETIALGSIVSGKLSIKDVTPSGINAGLIDVGLQLLGNAGPNQIVGSTGNDTITGGGGKDTLKGGAGDDVFMFNKPTDLVPGTSIDGGDGVDTLSFNGSGIYKLKDVTISNIEKIIIGQNSAAGLDLTGYTGADGLTIIGNSGNNTVTGLELKNEIFIGNGGNDKFDGGKITSDTSVGSSDLFVFKNAAEAKTTTIDGGATFVDKVTKVATPDAGIDTILFNQTSVSTSDAINTLELAPAKTKNIERVVLWSEEVSDDYAAAAAAVINPVLAEGTGTLNLNVNASKLTTGISIFGNDGLNRIAGGKGADILYGGAGSDVFVYESGGTGDLSKAVNAAGVDALVDTIGDWDGIASENDIIDYKTALSLQTAVTDPTAGVASVSASIKADGTGSAVITGFKPAAVAINANGLATVVGLDLLEDIQSVAFTLDAKETLDPITKLPTDNIGANGPKAGEVAYFVSGTDTYVFISDGKAGSVAKDGFAYTPADAGPPAVAAKPGKAGADAKPLTVGDVLIKITGDVTAGGAIIDTNGNLLFTADAGAGGSTVGSTDVLTLAATDTPVLTLGNDVIYGSIVDSLNESIIDKYTTDNDILNATIDSDLAQTITNIENINIIDLSGGHTVDATNITGTKQITLDSTNGNSVIITNVSGEIVKGVYQGIGIVKAGNNLTDLTVSGITNNPIIIQNKVSTLALDGSSALINLSGTALSLELVDAGTGLTALTLNSSSAPSVVTLGTGVVDGGTVTIKGTGNVTLKANAADLDITPVTAMSDTLSGSAKFYVDLTTVGATADLSGITTADAFGISSATPLDATFLTFKNGITNLSLNSNVVNDEGGFIAFAGGATDVLNLTVNIANTNLVTGVDGDNTGDFETVNLINKTGAALSTETSNFGTTAAVNITSSDNVVLGGATFKSINATNVTGNFSLTGAALDTATTIISNNKAAVIDMSASVAGGNNTITTSDESDVISIGAGNDIVDAKGGNDTVIVSPANWNTTDNLKGGLGFDTLVLGGTTGGAPDLKLGGAKFTGFEKISVADALTSTDLAVSLADASTVAGPFVFEAKAANTVGVSFDGSLDTNALFTIDVKSALADVTKNVIKGGKAIDTINFDGSTTGRVAVTGGVGADKITLSNTAAGSKIVLNKGDTGTVTTLSNGMSVKTMDVISGLRDGDILDLSAFASAAATAPTGYSVVKDPTTNFFTTMPALANNSVYQVKGTYNPTVGTFTAGNTATHKDSLFVYDSDNTATKSFQAVVAVNYAKDSTLSWASGLLTVGSTGVVLTTGADDFTQPAGARAAELTNDNNIIDGSVLDTLNDTDTIEDTSTADADVLNALVSVNSAPTIDKIETVNITFSTGGKTLDATGITAAKEVVVNNVSGTSVTVDGVNFAEIAALKAGDNITTLTATTLTNAVIVQNKATSINLSGTSALVDLSTAPLTLAKEATGTALTELGLYSNTTSTVTLGSGLVAGGDAIVVGTGDITLKASAADLALVTSVTQHVDFTGQLHVELTSVGGAAYDLSGVAADDFTISSATAMGANGLTFADGTTKLNLTKNVVTGLGGFTALTPASIATNTLDLTLTVANTNLVTANYGTVNLINATNNPLLLANTTATGAALTVSSTRDVTLQNAKFTSLDATGMTGSAKLNVQAVAIGAAATVIGNQNNATIDMGLNTGANTITTFAGNDILTGGSGNDIIDSGAGNDIIDTGSAGNDKVVAGAGSDAVFMVAAAWTADDTLQGGLGNDSLTLTGTGGVTIAPTALNFNGFESILMPEAQTVAVSITLADASASGAMSFIANQLNTAKVVFDAGQDTDTSFTVNVNSAIAVAGGATGNIIKTGDLNDSITFNGATAGMVEINAGKGGDAITLTTAAAGSNLVFAKGDTTALTVTELGLAGTLNLSALTTDVVDGAVAGDKIDLSAISTTLSSQGVVAPTASIPVAFANNQVYQITGGYNPATGVFTEAAAGADSIIVYDADATSGTVFEAIVLVGYNAVNAGIASGVLTL